MKLTIIVPVLNEADTLASFLQHLQPLRESGHQLIVVDGGSCDQSLIIAEPLCDLTLQSPAGRARQMNAGAARAEGDWLLFLHADTWLPQSFFEWTEPITQSDLSWGRFNVCLSGKRLIFRVIETCINWRSALIGIATGDQAIFVRRQLFESLDGFVDEPLMEDIELCRRLRKISAPLCLKQQAQTSSRRWESRGVLRTILLMWELRLRYYFGATPADLVQRYYPSN
jgi:rSAM/selenodomain-associated transferase 2